MRSLLSRARAARLVRQTSQSRSFHRASARATIIDSKGSHTSFDTEIRIGDPHEAYVYIEPDVGNAIYTSIARQVGTNFTQEPGSIPLDFNHESQHFSHRASPYPRIKIPRDLPRQNTGSNISPATLWLSGNWHSIKLDGTFDEFFERESRASASQWKEVLDKLKDA